MDFSGAALTVTATPTNVNPCVQVSIIDDIELDNLEIFTVSLVSCNPGVSVRPSQSSANVTIFDNDACKNSDKFCTHMNLQSLLLKPRVGKLNTSSSGHVQFYEFYISQYHGCYFNWVHATH